MVSGGGGVVAKILAEKTSDRAGPYSRIFFSLQLRQNEVSGQKQQGRAATV
jgi:hypothetical protein